MRLMIFFFPWLLLAVELPKPWLVYYNDAAPISAFAPYSPIVLNGFTHPPLKPLLKQKKELLGYVNIGEVSTEDSWFDEVEEQGLTLYENPDWPGSWSVDIRHTFWKKLLLKKILPLLFEQGFTGVFLDQIDVAIEKGMGNAAADLVKSIRREFPHKKIMMNRAYEILPAVGRAIDYELAETLYTSYDFATKQYFVRPEQEFEWQLGQLNSARAKFPHLLFFSLDYWDPNDREMVEKIYETELKAGVRPYVSTLLLDTITPLPAGNP